MDCIVYGVTKSWTQLKDFHFFQVQHTHNFCIRVVKIFDYIGKYVCNVKSAASTRIIYRESKYGI